MIRVQHLSCTPNGKRILDDVCMECNAGTLLGIIGPNGAGKSTLIKHLCGILKPPVGAVFIEGKDLRDYSAKELARHIAYVPQAKPSEFHFTVFEIVLMGRYPHLDGPGQPATQHKEAAFEALERVKMLSFADRSAATLSGGELQRVFLAAAIAQGSPILLVDEPTAFLDPKHERDIWLLLKQLVREEGRTVLAVTHAVGWVRYMSDFAVLMKGGRVMAAGASATVLTETSLLQLYDFPMDTCGEPMGGGPLMPTVGPGGLLA